MIEQRLVEALSETDTATPGMIQAALRFYEMTKSGDDDAPIPQEAIDAVRDDLPFPVRKAIASPAPTKVTTNG